MAAIPSPAGAPGGRRTLDIAGTAWPVYKLEALALAASTCLILALVTGSLQVAVLAAAGAAALRWVTAAVPPLRARSRR
jgi:hypothetical protein